MEEGFHFGAGVFVAGFCGGGDAQREDFLGIVGARFASEKLRIHKKPGNVVGVAVEEGLEMLDGGGGVAGVHALEGQAVAGEGVVGFLGDEFFEELAAGFFLFWHGRTVYS